MRTLYTRGLGTPTASQHNVFDSEKVSHRVLVLLTQAGFEPPIFLYLWISNPTLYQLSHRFFHYYTYYRWRISCNVPHRPFHHMDYNATA